MTRHVQVDPFTGEEHFPYSDWDKPGIAKYTDDWWGDQSVKADKGKPKLTLVPRQIIYDICEVREYGNAKYPDGGPDNWKQVDKQRYRDALFRHLLLYLDDPDGVDEESGISHLKHIACNVAFLCEMEKEDENTNSSTDI